MYVYVSCMLELGAGRGQKKASDLLELQLWIDVSEYVGARNRALFPLQKQQVLSTDEPSLQPLQ